MPSLNLKQTVVDISNQSLNSYVKYILKKTAYGVLDISHQQLVSTKTSLGSTLNGKGRKTNPNAYDCFESSCQPRKPRA